MKKVAFTLIELAIVIVLVSVVYILGFSNLSFFANKTEVKAKNLKSYLLKQNFENKLTLICLEDETCIIKHDGTQTEQIKNPFGKIYSVYKFDKFIRDKKPVYFADIKQKDNFKRVVLSIDFYKQGKHSNYIVESEEKVFIINSLFDQFIQYDSISDYLDESQKNISEVRDAF